MRILITGSNGLVGNALVPRLTEQGHLVTKLIRTQPVPGDNAVQWDPAAGVLDGTALEEMDAVIHLAGESLRGRWTPEKKARILESRVKGTRLLAETLAARARPPRVLITASAVGYYGDRGEAVLCECAAPGSDFLARVARQWEEAAQPAAAAGIRVAHLRFGVILSEAGGMLAEVLPLFLKGLGGRLGSGTQWLSWIALEDVLEIVPFVLATESLSGAVNAVSPYPVTNAEFTRCLANVLKRPAFFTVPAGVIRLLLGEAAQIVLDSIRAEPAQLLAAGYDFRLPRLEEALRHLLRSA